MSSSVFTFKQFIVHHSNSFKVGTDGVLLGAWTQIPENAKILDIGTGSGLLSLMMHQRSAESEIIGIDIQKESVVEAWKNVFENKASKRIKILDSSLQHFSKHWFEPFDLIISNPPFFQDDLKSIDANKNIAKHNDQLTLEELISSVANLLSEEGQFSSILPYRYYSILEELLANNKLFLQRICLVQNSPKHDIKRMLFSCGKIEAPIKTEENLMIRDSFGEYSQMYRKLCSEFYK